VQVDVSRAVDDEYCTEDCHIAIPRGAPRPRSKPSAPASLQLQLTYNLQCLFDFVLKLKRIYAENKIINYFFIFLQNTLNKHLGVDGGVPRLEAPHISSRHIRTITIVPAKAEVIVGFIFSN